nr:unnamed protein product [Spirometra erinaceieuropaei]
MPAKIVFSIETYYRSTTFGVLVHNNLSRPFDKRSGARQCCILSPILFNCDINWILGRATHGFDSVEFAFGQQQTGLDYADDIGLQVSSFTDLQSVMPRVNEAAEKAGVFELHH